MTHDLLIIGGGPAGLSAAVNAACEGLRVVVIEREPRVGGQVKHSSLVENLPGYVRGISGTAYTRRVAAQAKRFGAEFNLFGRANDLLHGDGWLNVNVDFPATSYGLEARSVILAGGLQWRNLDMPGFKRYYGRGIQYGCTMQHAPACKGCRVVIVGGANSAGQAAMYFAEFAPEVIMLVRGTRLTTSEYLTRRIMKHARITVRYDAEVVSVHGDGKRVRSLDLSDGTKLETSRVFVFIGAEPQTAWLGDAVTRDERGFIITSPAFETATPGLFAVGDVRNGIAKRVSAAVGDGAAVISIVQRYLTQLRRRRIFTSSAHDTETQHHAEPAIAV